MGSGFIKIDDYLSPNLNQVRHSIKGIEDSYNNDWDTLAEPIQNAVDAIRMDDSDTGLIEIEIDCRQRKIRIKDSGIGINPNDLPELLKPFSTNKSKVDVAVGEKGVGLKFVIFQTNDFCIKSGNKNGSSIGKIVDARNWKNSSDLKQLVLEHKKIDEEYYGTEIILEDLNESRIFDLTSDQMIYVLRTRTAIGSTKTIWGKDKAIAVTLKYKDINGEESFHNIPFSYMLPTELVNKNEKIDIDEFIAWVRTKDRTDSDKMKKLEDKLIYKKGVFTHNNSREISYFACFVPKRSNWEKLSLSINLLSKENLDDDDWLDEYYYAFLTYGITVSVKGMPTGISIDHPSTGYAGYWSNLFIIFEDPFTKFDIGRKSIHGRTVNIHKENSRKIFNDFLKYITRYISGDVVAERPEWDKSEIFDEIDKMIDINSDKTTFLKSPVDQEATVAAIFYELIGNGTIKNIFPIISGYRNRYDLYAKFGEIKRKKGVFEFKSKLKNIKKDFQDIRKMFDEIDCIVCWQITDEDRKILKELSLNIEEVQSSRFGSEQKQNVPHATHIMNITGFIKPIYIIDLYKVIHSGNSSI